MENKRRFSLNDTPRVSIAAGRSGVCKQFLLLLWKNFLLQIRRPIGTVAEVLIPMAAMGFVIALKYGLFEVQDRCFVTFDADPLTPTNPITFVNDTDVVEPRVIFFTPNTTQTRDIMELVSSKLPPDPFGVENILQGVENETELLTELANIEEGVSGCFLGGAGIVFDLSDELNIRFTLRLRHEVGGENSWLTRETTPGGLINFDAGPRIINNFYLSEGFLHLQNAVGLSIIQYLADQQEPGSAPDITVEMRQFPFPDYRSDIFLLNVGFVLPLFIMLSFIYSAGAFVKELVLEKDTRIRESMFMMGLTQWILWASWYLKQFIFLLISVVLMTIMISVGTIFPESNIFLLFIFLLLFILSMISYCFLLSVFFDSARIGLLFGFLGWFINYLPFFFLSPRFDETSTGGRIGACILSNTCMGLGVEVLARLDFRQEGLQFNNIIEPVNLDDSFHMGYVFMMLIADSIVYYILAWYINNVKPGQYGVPKPFYFPFLPSYWTGKPRKSKKKKARDLDAPAAGGYDRSAHEDEPTDLSVGISIKKLTKIYGTSWFSNLAYSMRSREEKKKRRKVAVNKLSLNMYKDQITALLGHNGAGKTTTMSILTGLFTPTSGSATINGLSILTNMDQIRHSLGICPQHNVLFDRLTVAEHLKFFCRLKGVWDSETVRNEVESMMEDLQLVDKEDVPAGALSGGQKRKLSVGIALVGGSEVVVLDEPTSGMDPYARRATWDLLVKHKQGRTILLSTHFMDEADLLGDRIAIMADGQLKVSGSSLFLKSRYGIGYHMTVEKEQHCDSDRVSAVVRSMVTGAKKVFDIGAELSFILPSSSTAQFPALFDALEACKTELAVSSFGVSVTTMEEVFMKVGEGTEETLDERVRRASIQSQGSTTLGPVSRVPTLATIHEEEGTIQVMVDSPSGTTRRTEVFDLTFANEDVFLPATNGATPLDCPPTDKPQVAETKFNLEESDERHRSDIEHQRSHTECHQSDNAAQHTGFHIPKNYTPNTGARLWFQQFAAMFLKRFYNSIRFFAAVLTQLILPMISVLAALILAETLPRQNADDEPRELRLDNSASSNNITLFWAQLQNPSGFNINFSDVTPESLGASNIFDRTRDIQDVMANGIQTGSDPQQCCTYEYQLLDKFCATRTESQLQTACSNNNTFGYANCIDRCLSCCTTQEERLPSCTYRHTVEPDIEFYCPSPPQVSYQDALLGSPTGALDSEGTFVAEYLMRFAKGFDTATFFQRYQAGFTITTRDPPYTVCGCQNEVEETCQRAFQPFGEASPGEDCPHFEVNMQSPPDSCFICAVGCSIPGCSTVEGVAATTLQNNSCNACPQSNANNSVGAVFPTPDQPPIAVTVWYNNQPWHMSAAALNSFHNILLRQTLNSSYTITVINHPRPRNIRAQVAVSTLNFTGFAVGTLVVFGYSFLIATFILFIVQEKETKSKHLQFVNGVHISSYWSAAFAWDLLNASIPVIISLVLFAAFQTDAYTNDGLVGAYLLLILVVWASIPLTYVFSFLFNNYLAAFMIFFCVYYFSAVVMQTLVFFIAGRGNRALADTLHFIFLTFPSYGLSIGLSDIFLNDIVREVCTVSEAARLACLELDMRPKRQLRFVDHVLEFPRPGVGPNLVYMAVEGFIFFILAMLLEAKFFYPQIKGYLGGYRNGDHEEVDEEAFAIDPLVLDEDSDVCNERKRVLTGQTTDNDVVIIKDLHKVYSSRLDGCTVRPAKAAVQGISLAIPNGECFGLLGTNGAGKTTTFSIITGDIPMTEGTASIGGFDIRTNLRDVQQRIGYCPQFDALINRLTGRELLTMYGRLRGIPEHLLKNAAEAIIQRLDLSKYSDKLCGTYSGGNKRKLSTGIALVGNPSIVLLDEPTTGMDVATRRHLWDVLISVIEEGRSIILTSHSMEECEALCTRLAIMVNGRFKCLGSTQHLKNKYGAGFTLQAKVQLAPPPAPAPQERVKSSNSLFSFLRQAAAIVGISDRRQARRKRKISRFRLHHQARLASEDFVTSVSAPQLQPQASRQQGTAEVATPSSAAFRLHRRQRSNPEDATPSSAGSRVHKKASRQRSAPESTTPTSATPTSAGTRLRHKANLQSIPEVITPLPSAPQLQPQASRQYSDPEVATPTSAGFQSHNKESLQSISEITSPTSQIHFQASRQSDPEVATPSSASSPFRRLSHRLNSLTGSLTSRQGNSDVFVFNPFDATALHNFMNEMFPGAILLEEHQGAVGYQLPGTGITWSSIFRQIESNKERLGIVDYSVSQTTLDQVFINFAREQEERQV